MIDEDSPPNIPAAPVPDEITALQERKTLPPVEVVDSKMVALALSSMATTLENISRQLRTLENQHDVTLQSLSEVKGAANLAGGMAARALEEIQEVKGALGKVALSVQGLEEASRSLVESVFPPRDSPSTPPDIELADVVPFRRIGLTLTGE